MLWPVFDREGDHVDDRRCNKPTVAISEDGVFVCQDCADQLTIEGFGTSFFKPDTSQIYKGDGRTVIVRADGTTMTYRTGFVE